MKIIALLVLLVFFSLGNGIRVLKGDQIPKDYPIGKIQHFQFGNDDRLFFQGQSNQLGFVDEKTGVITALYIVEEDQKIIEFRGREQIFISKGKSINLFLAYEEKYVKLHYSDFLEKQEFTKCLAIKRYFMYDYILTDTFLLKAQNPYAPGQNPFKEKTSEKVQILAQLDQGETFFTLVFLGGSDPDKVGIGAVSLSQDKSKLCIRKFYIDGVNGQKLCYKLDTSLHFLNVIEIGDNILVAYQEKRVIIDAQMNHIQETKEEQMITFIDELNIIAPNAGKNLASSSQGKTLAFFDTGRPRGSNTVQVYEKYMLVKRQNKVVANIPKKVEQRPWRIWAHTFEPESKFFSMIVEFENYKIKVFEINSQKNEYQDVWEIIISDFKAIQGGKQMIPVEVALRQEEELIEEGQKGAAEGKEYQRDQRDIGETPTEIEEPTEVQQQPPLLGNEGSGEPQKEEQESKDLGEEPTGRNPSQPQTQTEQDGDN